MLENARKRRKPKHYEGLAIRWSPVNQRWFVLWPGRGRIEDQQVLATFRTLDEAEQYADSITKDAMQSNPRRHRRKLSKHCQQIVSRTAAEEIRAGYPRAQAVAIGYSKARKAGCKVPAPPRLEDNPIAFWGRYLG